jgi:hypothetical protein
MPTVHAESVDVKVWEWVRDLLLNPQATLNGLQKEQANREKANKPLMDRLAVIDGLLTEKQSIISNLPPFQFPSFPISQSSTLP